MSEMVVLVAEAGTIKRGASHWDEGKVTVLGSMRSVQIAVPSSEDTGG